MLKGTRANGLPILVIAMVFLHVQIIYLIQTRVAFSITSPSLPPRASTKLIIHSKDYESCLLLHTACRPFHGDSRGSSNEVSEAQNSCGGSQGCHRPQIRGGEYWRRDYLSALSPLEECILGAQYLHPKHGVGLCHHERSATPCVEYYQHGPFSPHR